MLRIVSLSLFLLTLWSDPSHAQESDAAVLSPQTGTVGFSEAQARISLGGAYDFYGPSDTRSIVVDIWENPPSEVEGVLGLVMPRGASPHRRSWGAIITWEEIGYVDGETARDADYDELLRQMQSSVRAGNTQRRADGFSDVQLLGWAQRPEHDSVANVLTWGTEFTFFDGQDNTLHYDARVLGRNGVLSMNVVGTMDQLPEIRLAAADLARRVHFDEGARYTDFDAERDEVATYGMAGLIGAGAGVAIAKNVGVWALLAKLAQPFGIALLILAVALAAPFRKMFRRHSREASAKH